MSWERDEPRRRGLTPIGEELRHTELEVGKPSLRDRWRRRRRLLPRPTTWYGILLVGVIRFAMLLGIAVGLVLLAAYLGGWTDRERLAKVFIIAGGVSVAGLWPSRKTSWGWAYSTEEERGQQVSGALLCGALAACLLAIGFYLDATK